MAKEVKSDVCEKLIKATPCRAMFLGIVLFAIGLLRYLGYDWSIVLMVVGVMLFIKGIILKLKK